MMTLEEAISHAEDVAKSACGKCAEEHRQLAEWLRELKKLREQSKKGKWIAYTVSPFDGADVKCSECGQRGCATYWDYCPNCGARMEGVHVD